MSALLRLCDTPNPILPADFGITVSEVSGRTRVAVQGELDILTVPELRSVMHDCAEAGTRDVVVDLRDLDFLDAQGISVLVESWQVLRRRHRGLSLAAPSHAVRRVLDLTGLTEILPVSPAVPASSAVRR